MEKVQKPSNYVCTKDVYSHFGQHYAWDFIIYSFAKAVILLRDEP
jgi:hypothetical protein